MRATPVETASDAMSTDHVHVDSREAARDHESEQDPEQNSTQANGTRSGMQSPEPDPSTDQVALLQRSRYPLNSRRLTAAHLRAIAEAIGLPSVGSADQIRQCIEGKLQTEREDPNVVVVIREVQTTEQILALADSEGEFVRTPPLRRGQGAYQDEVTSRELQEAHAQLQEAGEIIQSAKAKDAEQARQISELHDALRDQEQQITGKFEDEVADLKQKVLEEKAKLRQSWKTSCEHLTEQDAIIAAKDEEIAELKHRLSELTGGGRERRDVTTHGPAVTPRTETPHVTEEGATRAVPTAVPLRPPGDHSIPGTPHRTLSGAGTREPATGDTFHGSIRRETSHWTDRPPPGAIPTFPTTTTPPHSLTHSDPSGHLHSGGHVHPDRTRRGKAPPIPFFSGEDPAVNVDDWLPSLERASTWNGWSMTEKVMQLPGYLKGRALQEWSLLSPTVQQDYTAAIEALRSRLDSTNRTMAAQEFRHSTQRQGESVADFIRRLEKAFQLAYGKDSLHSDTRDALLYSQLYDGLRYNLMRGPAVSGSQNYKELCVAARGEEHRLAALQQRHQLKPPTETSGRSKKPDAGQTNSRGSNQDTTSSLSRKQAPSSVVSETQVICYNCGMPGHMAKNCRQRKQESKGRTPNKTGQSQTKQVLSEDQGTSQS